MTNTETTQQEPGGELRRSLKARHLSMIAIGGSIGTGLFVASGASVAQVGPGGALLTYLVIGLMVFFIMTSLGEMAAFMPVSGSFATYSSRYVDEGFGFALGWNFWFSWAVTVAVDLVAAQLIMAYWLPDIPGYWWSMGFLALVFFLNAFSVRGFAESEYWFSLIKVVAVIVFIGTGLLMIAGILHGGADVAANWTVGDAPFVGNFATMVSVAMIVAFSFQGVELIGIAAGESENPRKNVPKAVRQVFWRILLFYVLAIAVIGSLIPYTDPHLLRNDVHDIAVSPFTLVFERAGLLSAAAVMNAVILTSVLSAGNSGMYAATRMLYTMAVEGKAPRIFKRVHANGVPVFALVATAVLAGLCFLSSVSDAQIGYIWLINTAGMTEFIVWMGISISHYRFRKGYVLHGHDLNDLPYRAGQFPLAPMLAFTMCLVITLGQNYQAFLQDSINWAEVIATYIGIPLFLAVWLGYRLVKKTRFVRYAEMQFPEAQKR